MILCDSEIIVALDSRQVEIDPPPVPEHISTTAVDLTLGSEFKRWRRPKGKAVQLIIDPSQPDFFAECEQLCEDITPDAEGAVVIEPGRFIRAVSRERI